MNAQLLDQARAAYRAGDFSAAAQMFAAAKTPGEAAGEVDHLRGNSLMRLGLYSEAAASYAVALEDGAYGKRGALLTNQGKALAAMGDHAGAASSFSAAVQDGSYATPYKAYMGLGNAQTALGNATEAGVAFRNAALDEANPAPAAALSSLGSCFIAISRPQDAIECYRSAMDCAGPQDDTHSIQAGMAEAMAAVGRYADAVEAFDAATADGIYQLTPAQASAYAAAQDTLSAHRSMAPAATGTGQLAAGLDPLDPLGQSGAFMPDPSDTGFFDLSEHEMIQQDKQDLKVRRRHRHTGLKVLIVILVLALLAGGGIFFALSQGLGYPSQQDALTGLFDAVTNGTEADQYLASALSDDDKSILTASVPNDAKPVIKGLDKDMFKSSATVEVELSMGGTMNYEVSFVREGIGWAVSGLSADFSSVGDDIAVDEGTDAVAEAEPVDDGDVEADADAE